MTPSAVSDRRTASSPWLWMNCWTRPFGSLTSSITAWASICVPNVSLRKVTVSTMYTFDSDSRSAICPPTSVPIATRNKRKARSTQSRIVTVARPRRQPRAASLLTPGSIARATKSETSSRINRSASRWNTWRATNVSRNPVQKIMTPGITQRGKVRSTSVSESSGTFGW